MYCTGWIYRFIISDYHHDDIYVFSYGLAPIFMYTKSPSGYSILLVRRSDALYSGKNTVSVIL